MRILIINVCGFIWFVVCAVFGAELIVYLLEAYPSVMVGLIGVYFVAWIMTLYWGQRLIGSVYVFLEEKRNKTLNT